ncbi:MAG: hypothetical protein RMJ46_00330, partial [Bacteroidota bacterium]|nr:hypothetical protein [Bacteroidota bacterium]
SQRGLVSLREELETVELYLQIEHIRFCQAFSYLVEVSPEVDLDEIWIPSLLLQPLVENALKHGLGPRGGRGKVYIRVVEQQDHVLCCVEDDGVGRRADKSQEMAHTGSGLLLTEERLRLLSQHLGENFGIRIVDLVHPDGSPAGTRVELSLPLCIDYLRAGELLLAGLAPNSIKPVFSP